MDAMSLWRRDQAACLSFLDKHGYSGLGPQIRFRIEHHARRDAADDSDCAVEVVKGLMPTLLYEMEADNLLLQYLTSHFNHFERNLGTGSSSFLGLTAAMVQALHAVHVPREAVRAGLGISQQLVESILKDASIYCPLPPSYAFAPAPSVLVHDSTDDVDWFFEDDPAAAASPSRPDPDRYPYTADGAHPATLPEKDATPVSSGVWSDTWLARGLQHCELGDWIPCDRPEWESCSCHLPYPEEICKHERIAMPMFLALNTAVLMWGRDECGEFYWQTRSLGSRYLGNASNHAERFGGDGSGERPSVCYVVRSTGSAARASVHPNAVPLLLRPAMWSLLASYNRRVPSGEPRICTLQHCYCLRVSGFGSERDGFKWQLGYEASENCSQVGVDLFTNSIQSIQNRPLDNVTLSLLNCIPAGSLIAVSGIDPPEHVYDLFVSRNVALVHITDEELILLSNGLQICILDDAEQLSVFCAGLNDWRFRTETSDVTLEFAAPAMHTQIITLWNGSITADSNSCSESLGDEGRLVFLSLNRDTSSGSDMQLGPVITVCISARTSLMCDATYDRFKRCLARLKWSIFGVDYNFDGDCNRSERISAVVPGAGALEGLLWTAVGGVILEGGISVRRYLESKACRQAIYCDHRDIVEVLHALQHGIFNYLTKLRAAVDADCWSMAAKDTKDLIEKCARRLKQGDDMSCIVLDSTSVVSCLYKNVFFCLEQLLCSGY